MYVHVEREKGQSPVSVQPYPQHPSSPRQGPSRARRPHSRRKCARCPALSLMLRPPRSGSSPPATVTRYQPRVATVENMWRASSSRETEDVMAHKECTLVELVTSDRKLKESREGRDSSSVPVIFFLSIWCTKALYLRKLVYLVIYDSG